MMKMIYEGKEVTLEEMAELLHTPNAVPNFIFAYSDTGELLHVRGIDFVHLTNDDGSIGLPSYMTMKRAFYASKVDTCFRLVNEGKLTLSNAAEFLNVPIGIEHIYERWKEMMDMTGLLE